MADPDIYGMLMGDEPTAAEQAKLYAQALRSQGLLGSVEQLSGNPTLAAQGNSFVAQSGQGQHLLAQLLENKRQRDVQEKHYNELAEWYKTRGDNQEENLDLQRQRLGRPDIAVNQATGKFFDRHGKLGQGGGGGAPYQAAPADNSQLDAEADYLAHTGSFLINGKGGPALAHNQLVLRHAITKHPDLDPSGALASFGANKHALSGITSTTAPLEAFANTAASTADAAAQLIKQVPNLGSTTINEIGRKVSAGMGSPEMARFWAAHQSAVSETAKVLSGGSAPTDNQRAEAAHLLNDAYTPDQYVAAVAQLKTEMAKRIQNLHQQADSLRGSTSSRAAPPPAAQTVAPSQKFYLHKNGMRIEATPNPDGKTGTPLPGAKPEPDPDFKPMASK